MWWYEFLVHKSLTHFSSDKFIKVHYTVYKPDVLLHYLFDSMKQFWFTIVYVHFWIVNIFLKIKMVGNLQQKRKEFVDSLLQHGVLCVRNENKRETNGPYNKNSIENGNVITFWPFHEFHIEYTFWGKSNHTYLFIHFGNKLNKYVCGILCPFYVVSMFIFAYFSWIFLSIYRKMEFITYCVYDRGREKQKRNRQQNSSVVTKDLSIQYGEKKWGT